MHILFILFCRAAWTTEVDILGSEHILNLTYTHLHSLNLLNFNELLFIFQFNWRLLINLIAVGCISVHDEHYAAMAYYTPAQCMISIAYCCMFI